MRKFKNEKFNNILFIFGFFIFVISNSTIISSELLINAKHIFYIVISSYSLVRFTKNTVISVLLIFPLAFCYALGSLWLYAGMLLIFAAGLPVFSKSIISIINTKNLNFLLIMLIISFIPFILSFESIYSNQIFSNEYGRPRMLMGYLHPKEASISFAIPILLWAMIYSESRFFIWAIWFIFIFLVGSRNVAMQIMLAWLFRYKSRFLKFLIPSLLTVCLLVVFIAENWLIDLNELLSNRIIVWTSALDDFHEFGIEDFINASRISYDNFFVEILSTAGILGFVISLFWVVIVGYILMRSVKISSWPFIAFILILFYSMFDSGIASTGNMMNIFLWSIMAPVFYEKNILGKKIV